MFNFINYFNSKSSYIEMKIIFGTSKFFEHIYVLIMLFNSEIKSNVFSWLYLVLVAFFWLYKSKSNRKFETDSVRLLNSTSIFTIIIQYAFLLCNITPQTSLIYLPPSMYAYRTTSLV